MFAIQRYSTIGAVDAAVRLYRSHFMVLFGVTACFAVPSWVASTVVQVFVAELGIEPTRDPIGFGLMTLGAATLTALIGVVCGILSMAAVTGMISTAALGRTPTMADGFSCALRVFWPLLGVSIIASIATAIGTLLFVVPGIFAYIIFAMATPVVVVEGERAISALDRSQELSRGRRFKILFVSCIVGLIWIAVGGGGSVLLTWLAASESTGLIVLQNAFLGAVGALIGPLYYAAIVMLYVDARVEKEAFDVQMLSRQTMAVEVAHPPKMAA